MSQDLRFSEGVAHTWTALQQFNVLPESTVNPTNNDQLSRAGHVASEVATAETNANAYTDGVVAAYTGSANIDTVGTVTAGTWQGAAIAIGFGGTGATTAATARANLGAVGLTGNESISGIKEFTTGVTFSGTSGHLFTGGFVRIDSGVAAGLIRRGGSQAAPALNAQVTGDAHPRWLSEVSGRQTWGPGNLPADVTLERAGTGLLRLTGDFEIVGDARLGAATTDTIGFYDATGVVQAASVADPAGGATVDAEARTAINSILAALRTTTGVGLIAG